MDKTQLLERYFNAFINIENTRDFFIGMTDYLDLTNSYEEFVNVSDDILAQGKPLQDKRDTLRAIALDKITTAYQEISDYIEKNKIDDASILEDLKECRGWLEGWIVGSHSKPLGFYVSVGDVIDGLYKLPEHKEFALKYIELYKDTPGMVNRYLPIKEVQELEELEGEIKVKSETELWGQLIDISNLYQTIKFGRERHKSLVEVRDKEKTSQASFNVMNHSMIVGEWALIEEKAHLQRDPYFFKIKKVRPWLSRLHNYLLKELALGTKFSKEQSNTEFSADMAILYVKGKPIKIRRTSDQYDVLRVLFEDKSELKREWFFDEIAEKIDQYASKEDKKYYNACYQLNRKLAEKGFADFFILNTHSLKITPHYLS